MMNLVAITAENIGDFSPKSIAFGVLIELLIRQLRIGAS